MVPTRCVGLTRQFWQMFPRCITIVSSRKFTGIDRERLCSFRNDHSAFNPSLRSVTTTAKIYVSPSGGCQGKDGVSKQADDCGGNKFAPACIAPQLVAHYEEIIDLPNHPEKLLIDVREPTELTATGQIPTSINIPLKQVSNELQLTPAAFESKYGRKKPAADDPMIFYCRIGVRSGNAAHEADKLGFKRVKNYAGSWLEYAEKQGLPS